MAKFQLTLKINKKQVKKDLLRVIHEEVSKLISANVVSIETQVKDVIIKYVESSEEWQSMLSPSGILRTELGLENQTELLSQLSAAIKDIIHIKSAPVKLKGNKVSGGFKLVAMTDSDYEMLLNSSFASFVSENGFDVDWLEWILVRGNQIVVYDYVVDYGWPSHSRTNDAIMLKYPGVWQVPSQFSGVKEDNFITRSIEKASKEIEDIILKNMQGTV